MTAWEAERGGAWGQRQKQREMMLRGWGVWITDGQKDICDSRVDFPTDKSLMIKYPHFIKWHQNSFLLFCQNMGPWTPITVLRLSYFLHYELSAAWRKFIWSYIRTINDWMNGSDVDCCLGSGSINDNGNGSIESVYWCHRIPVLAQYDQLISHGYVL